jgi:hypothetical protein
VPEEKLVEAGFTKEEIEIYRILLKNQEKEG